MDKNEMQIKVEQEEDYIRCPKCSNSLSKFLAKNPDGVDDKAIARLLMISEDEVHRLHTEAVDFLRKEMVPDEGSEE